MSLHEYLCTFLLIATAPCAARQEPRGVLDQNVREVEQWNKEGAEWTAIHSTE